MFHTTSKIVKRISIVGAKAQWQYLGLLLYDHGRKKLEHATIFYVQATIFYVFFKMVDCNILEGEVPTLIN